MARDIERAEVLNTGYLLTSRDKMGEGEYILFLGWDDQYNRGDALLCRYSNNNCYKGEWKVSNIASPLNCNYAHIIADFPSVNWHIAFARNPFYPILSFGKYKGIGYSDPNATAKYFFVTAKPADIADLNRRKEAFFGAQTARVSAEAEALRLSQIEAERRTAEAEHRRKIAEEERVAAEERRKADEERERIEEIRRKEAEEAAFWNSPEGMKVRAARLLADIERQKILDAANIRIAEQERISDISRELRREERESQETLISQIRDL